VTPVLDILIALRGALDAAIQGQAITPSRKGT
jgi:hypothetical protein